MQLVPRASSLLYLASMEEETRNRRSSNPLKQLSQAATTTTHCCAVAPARSRVRDPDPDPVMLWIPGAIPGLQVGQAHRYTGQVECGILVVPSIDPVQYAGL